MNTHPADSTMAAIYHAGLAFWLSLFAGLITYYSYVNPAPEVLFLGGTLVGWIILGVIFHGIATARHWADR